MAGIPKSNMKIYFVSGHRDITYNEFVTHYLPILNKVVREPNSKFVVGDYEGVDLHTQVFFRLLAFRPDVTVYHMGDKPMRCEAGWFKTKGGFTNDEERDAAMTAISDEDIAWVRKGKENSGTAININRRKIKE
jgi:hypothetical protein